MTGSRFFRRRQEHDHSERFFYHSFPRRGHSTSKETEKGCKILSLICEAGLILAPEVVAWSHPHADGTPPRTAQVIQRRICFTELAPGELAEHAKEFGNFALEFDVHTLKRLGAMPVFYIPLATGDNTDGVRSLGSTLVLQSIDAMMLAMRLVELKKIVDDPSSPPSVEIVLGNDRPQAFQLNVSETRKVLEALAYAITPADMMEHALTGLVSCFYPADNLRNDSALAYYRQREWRIAWNFAINDVDVMRRPCDELIARLLEIDADFFGRDFPTMSDPRQLASEALVFPGIANKRIIEMVNRVVVPRAALASARTIVARFAPSIPVVCIEDVK